MQKTILFFLVATTLFACGQKTVKSLVVNDLVLSADGPYFEGPNTFQSTLSKIVEQNQLNPEEIDRIELISAEVILPDSISADLIQDMSLQLVSSQSEMKKVAFINPVPSQQKSIKLTTAEVKDDLSAILKNEEAIVLLDANLKKDYESNLSFKTNLTFNVTLK